MCCIQVAPVIYYTVQILHVLVPSLIYGTSIPYRGRSIASVHPGGNPAAPRFMTDSSRLPV